MAWGITADLITPEEARRKIPILNVERIYSALYVASDGVAKGPHICEALANQAEERGATFYGNTEVTGIEIENGQLRTITTTRGRIQTRRALVCAGIFGDRGSQHTDCYGIGSYLHEPLLVDPEDIPKHGEATVMPSILSFAEEHFARAHASAIELFPRLRDVGLNYKINGMFSFTPDGLPLIGESQQVRGFWVVDGRRRSENRSSRASGSLLGRCAAYV